MKINLPKEFLFLLGEIVDLIANDKPLASRKFKKDLIIAIKKICNFLIISKNLYISMKSKFVIMFLKVTQLHLELMNLKKMLRFLE